MYSFYAISLFLPQLFISKPESIFLSLPTSVLISIILSIMLNQFKTFRFSPPTLTSRYDNTFRDWTLDISTSCCRIDTKFINLLCTLLPKHIPKVYLEGYYDLIHSTTKFGWPSAPKCIFDSNSNYALDSFKAWAAETIYRTSCQLFIGQHGGSFGMARCNFIEDHQISISDGFLTWDGQIVPISCHTNW